MGSSKEEAGIVIRIWGDTESFTLYSRYAVTCMPASDAQQKCSSFAINILDIGSRICSRILESSSLMTPLFSVDSSNDEGIHGTWEISVFDSQPIVRRSCFTESSFNLKAQLCFQKQGLEGSSWYHWLTMTLTERTEWPYKIPDSWIVQWDCGHDQSVVKTWISQKQMSTPLIAGYRSTEGRDKASVLSNSRAGEASPLSEQFIEEEDWGKQFATIGRDDQCKIERTINCPVPVVVRIVP